jgi:nicotinamide mononucleotide adenylyltransferase
MKSFLQFLSEVTTEASKQAREMGLTGDGHGGWVDDKGTYIAKTVKGKLYFFGKGKGKQKPEKAPAAKASATKSQQAFQLPSPAPMQQTSGMPLPAAGTPEQGAEQEAVPLTIVFGRFNPPTIGHKKLLDRAKAISKGSDLLIFPSRSHDPKKNPLSPSVKIDFMRQMFPKYVDNIVDDASAKTIFDVLVDAQEQGYNEVTIVVGADRLKEFENLAIKYNGELYNFNDIKVISAGERDAESEGVEGMSASKLRKFAAAGDYESFTRGVPKELDDKSVDKLYKILRKSMNIKEGISLWEIAPKLDYSGLRENYVGGHVFIVGDVVQNDNTGLCGEIIRAGANHVIAITENGIMFKSWIKDISEVFTNVSGVPADQRLVGTDSYREYVRRLTPPKKAILNFINKSRKSR